MTITEHDRSGSKSTSKILLSLKSYSICFHYVEYAKRSGLNLNNTWARF